MYYCSSDAPAAAFTYESTIIVAGVPVSVDNVYESLGMQCNDSYSSHPAASAGNQPVVITNVDGSRATGTIEYVLNFPGVVEIFELSAIEGPNNVASTITLSGAGFSEDTVVILSEGLTLPTEYVDAGTVRVTIPAATSIGFSPLGNEISTLQARNPGSEPGQGIEYTFRRPPGVPAPVLISINPGMVAYYASGVKVIITGSGFAPETEAYRVNNGKSIPVRYIDSTQIKLSMPPGGINDDIAEAAGGQTGNLLNTVSRIVTCQLSGNISTHAAFCHLSPLRRSIPARTMPLLPSTMSLSTGKLAALYCGLITTPTMTFARVPPVIFVRIAQFSQTRKPLP